MRVDIAETAHDRKRKVLASLDSVLASDIELAALKSAGSVAEVEQAVRAMVSSPDKLAKLVALAVAYIVSVRE